MFVNNSTSGDLLQLPKVRYDDAGTERVVFTLPPTDAPERDSILIFALPKSGSVLLNAIMRDLSSEVGLRYVSIMREYFVLGIPDELHPADTAGIFLPKGYCYGGFRNMPGFQIPVLPIVKKILLVRDPRDMLVSHYYSMLNSHPSRGAALATSRPDISVNQLAKQVSIDEYVRQIAPAYRKYFEGYKALCTDYSFDAFLPSSGYSWFSRLATKLKDRERRIRVYRYEDVIYVKERWIRDICDWFGILVSRQFKVKLAQKHDKLPPIERVDKHIRQVHPGNYHSKLSPDTVVFLNKYFFDDMKFFGYI